MLQSNSHAAAGVAPGVFLFVCVRERAVLHGPGGLSLLAKVRVAGSNPVVRSMNPLVRALARPGDSRVRGLDVYPLYP